jgi:hypothetical protein
MDSTYLSLTILAIGFDPWRSNSSIPPSASQSFQLNFHMNAPGSGDLAGELDYFVQP